MFASSFDFLDGDGDSITIYNNLDFEILRELKINKVTVSNKDFVPAQATEVRPTFTRVDDSIRENHHASVICDVCDSSIFGYRYKCLECYDFDMCMNCDKLHPEHVLIRITNPNDADICHKLRLSKRMMRLRRQTEGKSISHKHRTKQQAASTGASNFAETIPSAPGPSTSAGTSQPNTNTGNAQSSSTQCPGLDSFPFFPYVPLPKRRCDPLLRQGLDTISNLAQNFTAMMDPFARQYATYTEDRKNMSNMEIMNPFTRNMDGMGSAAQEYAAARAAAAAARSAAAAANFATTAADTASKMAANSATDAASNLAAIAAASSAKTSAAASVNNSFITSSENNTEVKNASQATVDQNKPQYVDHLMDAMNDEVMARISDVSDEEYDPCFCSHTQPMYKQIFPNINADEFKPEPSPTREWTFVDAPDVDEHNVSVAQPSGSGESSQKPKENDKKATEDLSSNAAATSIETRAESAQSLAGPSNAPITPITPIAPIAPNASNLGMSLSSIFFNES